MPKIHYARFPLTSP